ncbi:MAG: class I SAM-dependent methyltransferase [Roseiflexaceae bacterium]
MQRDDVFEQFVHEGENQPFQGWDFGFLEGRYRETPTPWSYEQIVRDRLATASALLDMGTGGGEFLSSLAPLPSPTFATEGYPPNLPIAEKRLAPLGVTVVAIGDDDRIPVADQLFDLVINRHESFDAHEVARVLKPGGWFITQQVGGTDGIELNQALQDVVDLSYGHWDLAFARQQIEQAGLRVERAETAALPSVFTDIGAIVYYLRAAPWQVEGFAVATHREKLWALHQKIQAEGTFVMHSQRFLVIAQKPAT